MKKNGIRVSSARSWQVLTLGLSLVCDLWLFAICRVYYSILSGFPGVIGSRVDSRGGLWEISFVVPTLAILAAVAAIAAARIVPKRFPSLTLCLASLAIILWGFALTLVHFIRTSLH